MIRTIYFGGGCFWCVESIYLKINGVVDVKPGYMGGSTINPTYEEVCEGNTDHVEVAKVMFDETIKLSDLLKVFFSIHDPTTLNRQGADVGTQYRSAIFCEISDRAQIIDFIQNIEKSDIFKDNIVTEVNEVVEFYEAEEYHHNYFKNNPNNSYCQIVVSPKIEKFNKGFPSLISK